MKKHFVFCGVFLLFLLFPPVPLPLSPLPPFRRPVSLRMSLSRRNLFPRLPLPFLLLRLSGNRLRLPPLLFPRSHRSLRRRYRRNLSRPRIRSFGFPMERFIIPQNPAIPSPVPKLSKAVRWRRQKLPENPGAANAAFSCILSVCFAGNLPY